MQYIDVRVRMPVTKVGLFILEIPSWAQLMGIDKLEEDIPSAGRPKVANGEYQPQPGSTIEKVLRYLEKNPGTIKQVTTVLKSHKKQAVSSAIGSLHRRHVIIKQKDGTYAIKR